MEQNQERTITAIAAFFAFVAVGVGLSFGGGQLRTAISDITQKSKTGSVESITQTPRAQSSCDNTYGRDLDGGGDCERSGNVTYTVVSGTSSDATISPSCEASPTDVGIDETVTFDASGSSSSNPIATYAWIFDDTTADTTSQATTTHSYESSGTYNPILGVEDDTGAYTTTTCPEVTVGSGNQCPSDGDIQDDSYSTGYEETLNESEPGALGNDADPDGDNLEASVESSPSYGDLTLNDDGSFEYDPDNGFSGTDTFTYRTHDVTGSSSCSATAQVDIDVGSPTASCDYGPTDEGDTVSGTETLTADGNTSNWNCDLENGNGNLTSCMYGSDDEASFSLDTDTEGANDSTVSYSVDDTFQTGTETSTTTENGTTTTTTVPVFSTETRSGEFGVCVDNVPVDAQIDAPPSVDLCDESKLFQSNSSDPGPGDGITNYRWSIVALSFFDQSNATTSVDSPNSQSTQIDQDFNEYQGYDLSLNVKTHESDDTATTTKTVPVNTPEYVATTTPTSSASRIRITADQTGKRSTRQNVKVLDVNAYSEAFAEYDYSFSDLDVALVDNAGIDNGCFQWDKNANNNETFRFWVDLESNNCSTGGLPAGRYDLTGKVVLPETAGANMCTTYDEENSKTMFDITLRSQTTEESR
jgi:VCBS repeat-containing protein